jgi:flagellar export protein FliJ
MAFLFSLDTVLRVRGILEEREERLLQKILFEISQTLEALARTDAEIAGSDASRSTDLFKPVIGRSLHASYGALKELRESRNDLEGQIEILEKLRDRQRIVYEGARRNREMLTDIRAEKRCNYESDTARREQKTLDDNYIARRGHRWPLR